MILEYDLLFFAEGQGGEKTEPATEKKLEDARKEGQVAKSKEIANCLGLLAMFLILRFMVGTISQGFLETFSTVYNRIDSTVIFYSGNMPANEIYALVRISISKILTIMLPILIIGFVVAFMADFLQVKWKPTAKPLQPKLSKINPVSGFKRIFSLNSLMELIKAIAKVILIALVTYNFVRKNYSMIFTLYDISLLPAVKIIGSYVVSIGIQISAIYAAIAFADFLYQKFKFQKDMKMTKQEVKDEYKQAEGDPQIKGKIRQKMMEASRRRMMQNLPKADVVITNPTHYAVAIRYDASEAEAPVVIAKGEGYLAQRIKDVAKGYSIEIVENKSLARMLYHNVEIGQMVPPELYQAVAEVLAFVYHLQGKA